MKKNLKDFIGQNRSAFDDQDVPESSWKTIEEGLPSMKQRSLWNSLVLWRVAAVLLLGLSVYLFTTRTALTPKKELASNQAEFNDLESFYSDQIAEKVAMISEIDALGESEPFTQDFQKLDAMYQVLREEMKNHPSAKVKDAMVLNLLVRIDLLNQQLKKLEDSRRASKEVIA